MIIEFSKKPFSKLLLEDSKTIEPTTEQCEQILQKVLKKTDQQPASYEKAMSTVRTLAKSTQSKGRLFVLGTGSFLLAASLFLVIAVNPAQVPMNTIQIEDSNVPLSDSAAFTDRYKVNVTVAGESLADAFYRYEVANNCIQVFLSTNADIQWDTIYAIQDGIQVPPSEIHSAEGFVVFPLPETQLDIHIFSAADECVVTIQPER